MQIPTTGATDLVSAGCVATRNTKEAALLYALSECEPFLTGDRPSARWESVEGGKPICWFFFKQSEMASRIHSAFGDPGFEARHAGEAIPDQHMGAVLALMKTMWHNWERLCEVTRSGPTSELPLHHIVQRDGKLHIFTKPKSPNNLQGVQ